MPNDNEELNSKFEKLEKKVEDLEKKLEKNTKKDKERDKQHHEELKAITQQNHKENLTWNKMGAFSAPIATVLVGAVIAYFQNKQITPQQIAPIKKDADSMSEKMDKILEAIKDKNN